jgi:hypothetical protein
MEDSSDTAQPRGDAARQQSAGGTNHELLQAFAEQGFELNATLREMLNEHHSHRTERRGAGFTQATRHLAVLINRGRPAGESFQPSLFARRFVTVPTRSMVEPVLARLAREESRLLGRIILDVAFGASAAAQFTELPVWSADLKIGTCPLAEKYFLELADSFVRRKGRANVLVSGEGKPLLVEKLNLGDDHSCISVAPLRLNGVDLPRGSLFGVHYQGGVTLRKNRHLPGEVIPVDRCAGFRFLRLSTLAVSPEHRERAFTAHFQAQLDAGLFAPREATVDQLQRLAAEQL